jgi:hypothetical protein
MTSVVRLLPVVIVLALAAFADQPAEAQELEPRAYRTLPSGLDFIVFAYSFSSGNVVLDPSVPIEDLKAEIHSGTLAWLHSFGMAGRSSSFTLTVPYVYMSASGLLQGQFRQGSRTDWADSRARLAVNLAGGPALTPKEFARFEQKRALGVSLTILMPTGQYSPSYIINFGANRWGFKPEIGYSSVRGNWIFEAAAGVWLFMANSSGMGGTTIRQDPIMSLQAHLSYNLPRGIWLGLNVNYFEGGRTTIDGQPGSDIQKNSRVGLTLSLPLRPKHSLKLAAHTGAFTRIGADFDIGTIAYQYQWGQ